MNRNEKFLSMLISIMLVCALAIILLVFNGCTMAKPKISDLPADMSKVEKAITFDWLMCGYMQQFNKNIDMRCGDILSEKNKNRIILNFNDLKEEKKLPTLYNQSGAHEMDFDDYFKYIK